MTSYDRENRVPLLASEWVWEPNSVGERIVVTEVKWNGEEWWVRTRGLDSSSDAIPGWRVDGAEHWNDLDRFWEAVKPLAGTKDSQSEVRVGVDPPDEP